MLDAILSVDQPTLEYVANLPGGRDLVIALAQKDHEVNAPDIVNRFGLSEMLSDQSKDHTFIASFLYYFGVLTLAGETEQGGIAPESSQYRYAGNVCGAGIADDAAQSRYSGSGGGCGQTGVSVWRDRADLTMIIRPDQRHLKIFDVLIEFKFVGLKDLNLSGEAIRAMTPELMQALPLVGKAIIDGRKQVLDYGNRLIARYRTLRLKGLWSLPWDSIGFVT